MDKTHITTTRDMHTFTSIRILAQNIKTANGLNYQTVLRNYGIFDLMF